METRQQVNTFLINYECDECEAGIMEYAEMLLPSTWGGNSNNEEPKWKHLCNSCSAEQTLNTKYPYTTYEYY